MTVNNNVGECINLYIPPNQSDEFWKVITEAGFTKDSKGVIEYVLEPEEDWNEEIPTAGGVAMGAVKEWADKHPEEWNRIRKKGSSVVGNLFSKIASKL